MVSIIMPAFNASRYIGQAIQSVIDQTHPVWELLVIDDGSTDNTRAVVQSFSDDRIRYFYQPNKGVSAARNVGLDNMRGTFLCFLDADDLMTPQALASRLPLFEGDIRFVDGAVAVYDESLQHELGQWMPSWRGRPFHKLVRLSDACFHGVTWMIKITKPFPYRFDTDITHGEDILFFMTVAHLGSYTYTAETIGLYRKNTGSAMSNLDGLARGYEMLRRKVRTRFATEASFADRATLFLKSRKIMFLSFAAAKRYRSAVRYLLSGSPA